MKRVMAALLLLAGAAQAGPWPTDNITTTHVDAATDDPSQARAEIYTTMLRVKDVIGARNSASGVAPLDASALVPLANIPATLTGKSADTLDGINSTSFARVDAASNFTTAPTISGNTVWHAGNDGAGSGLDADTFKGSSTIAVANGGTGSTTAAAARTALGAAASGANSDITSMSGLTGAVSSAKTCASGYTRVSPNYCKRIDTSGSSSLARDVCTAVAAPSADAKAIEFQFIAIAGAGNANAMRYAIVSGYRSTGTCIFNTQQGLVQTQVYEFNPIGAGSNVSISTGVVLVAPPSTGGNAYLLLDDDSGNQGEGLYVIVGYYD